MVKKVHLRVIIREHAKIKSMKPSEAVRAGPPLTPQKSAVLQLIPFADEVMDFQHLGPSIHENLPFLVLVVPAFASPHLTALFFSLHTNLFGSSRLKITSQFLAWLVLLL